MGMARLNLPILFYSIVASLLNNLVQGFSYEFNQLFFHCSSPVWWCLKTALIYYCNVLFPYRFDLRSIYQVAVTLHGKFLQTIREQCIDLGCSDSHNFHLLVSSLYKRVLWKVQVTMTNHWSLAEYSFQANNHKLHPFQSHVDVHSCARQNL